MIVKSELTLVLGDSTTVDDDTVDRCLELTESRDDSPLSFCWGGIYAAEYNVRLHMV